MILLLLVFLCYVWLTERISTLENKTKNPLIHQHPSPHPLTHHTDFERRQCNDRKRIG